MSVQINSVENHKTGSFYVNLRINGRWYGDFSSMLDALDAVREEKSRKNEDVAYVTLKEVVIMAYKKFAYESCYCL